MSISQITTSNTFGQWLQTTQALVDKYNFVETSANLVISLSNSVSSSANTVANNTAFVANTANDIFSYVGTAFDTANTVLVISQDAYDKSNDAFVLANLAFELANTSETFGVTNDVSSVSLYYPAILPQITGTNNTITVSSTKLFYSPSTGILTAVGFNQVSDIDRKKNIIIINNATETLKQLEGIEFDWVENGQKSSGVVAQELEKILPHLVADTGVGFKSVNYTGLIAYLIQSVKELSNRIDILENK
jgi:hypothetical protein